MSLDIGEALQDIYPKYDDIMEQRLINYHFLAKLLTIFIICFVLYLCFGGIFSFIVAILLFFYM